VSFEPVDPSGPEAQRALHRYLSEVSARIVNGLLGPDAVTDVEDLTPPAGVFLLGRSGGAVVACGAVRALGPGIGEIKRMWVEPKSRGRGFGARLLRELEAAARESGYQLVRLDIHLYETHGYRRIPRYHDHPDPTHFYEKSLS
jgi:GNAT superfamily N-acetyltransferase